MNDQLARVVGDRVRFYRTAAHQTKTVVAGLTGITPDYLYQIERGLKLPTIAVLAQLAQVLRVEPGDLLNTAPATREPRSQTVSTSAIYRAMTVPVPPTVTQPALPALHAEVRVAWRAWQTSPRRYRHRPSRPTCTDSCERSQSVSAK
jgi:transcriptional regulator with XRE-family HTH domain